MSIIINKYEGTQEVKETAIQGIEQVLPSSLGTLAEEEVKGTDE